MTNAAKSKGAAFEALVRDYLRGHGFPVERIPPGMAHDRGDIHGIPDLTLELKCLPRDLVRAISDGMRDLEIEQANADTAYGAVIAKRPRSTDPGKQLVVMELWQFVRLLQAMGGRKVGT